MIKYFVYPGKVRSESDGLVHYVDSRSLMDLYGVPPMKCRIILSEADERGYRGAEIIRLRPLPNGKYKEALDNLKKQV